MSSRKVSMEQQAWDEYAATYHENIISPFQERVKNPLVADLERLGTNNLVVADIGCGIGDFLPFLAQQFRDVHAIDFSEQMLVQASQRQQALKNVTFHQADMRELTSIGAKFDVAIAVNSVLHPNPDDVQRSLEEIRGCLNDDGLFLGIFPSMESVLYNFSLVYDREFSKEASEERALRQTKRICERRKYNFITGVYEDGSDRQKFYYEFELGMRLRRAGFKNIKFKKVLYPWGAESGDYEDFHGMPEMWDWYVTAKK